MRAQALLVASVLAVPALAAPAAAQDELVGSVLTHRFQQAPFRSHGLERLEDLRGALVWIEYWSPTSLTTYGVTVPTALKLQEKHGDALQVLCVDVSGSTHQALARWVVEYRWAESRAIWSIENPVGGGLTVPWAVVVGDDGEVLAAGNSMEEGKRLTDAFEAALAARKKGPKGTPAPVSKAWGEFAKGRLGKALVVAREAAAKAGGKKPDVAAAAHDAELAVTAAVEARLSRAGGMLGSGHYAAAHAELTALGEAVEGDEAFTARVAELLGTLQGEAAAAELAADLELARLEAKAWDKGLDDGIADDLLDFAREHEGIRAAARARDLAAIVRKG